MADTSDRTLESPTSEQDASTPPPPEGHRRADRFRDETISSMLRRLQIVILAPFSILLVLSVGSFVYAGYLTVQLAFNTSWSSGGVSDNIVQALQVIDVCLIGTAALVIAAEALVMFMANTDASRGVAWLGPDSVDSLKNRALSMVVLILVVTFLEVVVHPQNGRSELELGLAVATVIVSIALYLLASRSNTGGAGRSQV